MYPHVKGNKMRIIDLNLLSAIGTEFCLLFSATRHCSSGFASLAFQSHVIQEINKVYRTLERMP